MTNFAAMNVTVEIELTLDPQQQATSTYSFSSELAEPRDERSKDHYASRRRQVVVPVLTGPSVGSSVAQVARVS